MYVGINLYTYGHTICIRINTSVLGIYLLQNKNLFVSNSSAQPCIGHKQEVKHNKRINLFIQMKAFTSMDLLLLKIQNILNKWKLE